MATANLDQARQNMVEHQVRPWDVLDDKILHTIDTIRREAFVPDAYKGLAYADTEIPLGDNECMMHPVLEGRMLQALEIQPMDVVLEIGTGSGFITACLAHLASHVDTVEIHESLSRSAAERLKQMNILNVNYIVADAVTGFTPSKAYDVIAITGSMAEVPETYKQALAIGGRMFVITGQAPVMEARLITRTGENTWAEQMMFETSLKSLIHAEAKKQFQF